MKRSNSIKLSLLASSILVSQFGFASGFEKSIPWGGQTSGVAGIGTSYMQGSQALFFNPAGLVSDKSGAQDVSLNLSPTMPSWNETTDAAGTQQTSTKTLLPFALMYGANITDNLGFGIGGYVSGGSYADFTDTSLQSNPESKIDLTISEIALGVGYKVMDNLKIGAAWRVVKAQGNLDIVEATSNASIDSQNSSLTDTEYTGFKLGAQYKLSDKWDLGLTYRSGVSIKAKGNQTNYLNGTVAGTAGNNVTVGTLLPPSTTLGSTYMLTDTWRLYGEYAFTQYSQVTNLSVNADGQQASALQLQWKDQHNIRIAAEYKGYSLPIRFGYIYTTQVTNQNYMIAGLTPPGAGNTFTLGTGSAFTLGGQNLRADAGFEYTVVQGSSSAAGLGSGVPTSPLYTTGSNSVNEIALHLGAQYMF